ncbi:hypothetical protein ACWDUL_20090 [Nocardia niigatensis]
MLASGPPTSPQQLPIQVYSQLSKVFGWFLWMAIVLSIIGLIAAVTTLLWQRRSQASTHLLEEAVVLRILIACAVTASCAAIANDLIPHA